MDYTPLEGSIELPCAGCGEPCWIGPNSQTALALAQQNNVDNYVMCPDCVREAMKQNVVAPSIVAISEQNEVLDTGAVGDKLRSVGVKV
jgi:hypothetical protein